MKNNVNFLCLRRAIPLKPTDTMESEAARWMADGDRLGGSQGPKIFFACDAPFDLLHSIPCESQWTKNRNKNWEVLLNIIC